MRTLLAIVFTIHSFIALAEAQEYGLASVYSASFQGKRTASGEFFDHNALTAAHQKYPFGSMVKVTRVDNGKWVIVRINDRGPYVNLRVTDLSKAAAKQLGFGNEKDEVRVKLELVSNRISEIAQSKGKNNSNDSPNPKNLVDKADITAKNGESNDALKAYNYVPSKSSKNKNIQKKNQKL